MGLRELMSALGLDLPSMDIILAPRTIITAFVVGLGVTLFASLTPARRAAHVPRRTPPPAPRRPSPPPPCRATAATPSG